MFSLYVKIEINAKIAAGKRIKRKNRETVQNLVRVNRGVMPRKTVPLFYFNAAKETKSEKSFWRFANR